MFNTAKTLIAATAFVATAGIATAEDRFTADFTFSPAAPVEVTYAQFEETAKDACRISVLEAGGLSMKRKIENACTENLIRDAVNATGLVSLIVYHEQSTSPAERRIRMARNN